MLVHTPFDQSIDQKDIVSYYFGLLKGLGINADPRKIQVSVHGFNGDFACYTSPVGSGVGDFLFDIGNPALGNITLGAQTSRTLYHGSLQLLTRITAQTGGGVVATTTWLSTGPNSNLTHWMVKNRRLAVAAVDLQANSPEAPGGFLDQLDNVMFNYIRKNVGTSPIANDATETTEILFNGVRVDY